VVEQAGNLRHARQDVVEITDASAVVRILHARAVVCVPGGRKASRMGFTTADAWRTALHRLLLVKWHKLCCSAAYRLSNGASCSLQKLLIAGSKTQDVRLAPACHDDHIVQGQGGDVDGELRGHVPLRCQ